MCFIIYGLKIQKSYSKILQYQSPNINITSKKSDTIILHRTFNCKIFPSSYIIIFLSIFTILNLANEKALKAYTMQAAKGMPWTLVHQQRITVREIEHIR